MHECKSETLWRVQTFEDNLTSVFFFFFYFKPTKNKQTSNNNNNKSEGVCVCGGGGGGRNGWFKACLVSVYPAAIVTLTCKIQYSDDKWGSMKKKKKKKKKAWNAVVTLLLPAKVICTSSWQTLRDLSNFLFWHRPHGFLASKGEYY